jgi:protein SDA1
MSKTELKADKKNIKEGKDKFKHKPKDKTGGSTNREKNKLKPLMMVRAKKNKIRSNEKQLKTKIKHLKNQLGKVRSGKEAKKIRNKKVVKKTTR